MINVVIDGKPMTADIGHINAMTDLVEFIKANIDPTTIITDMRLNEKALSDIDWRMPLSVQGDAVLEIITGAQGDFITERLETSSSYLAHIILEFDDVYETFQEGITTEGNKKMGQAVNDLNAFLQWYRTILSMLPPSEQKQIFVFNEVIKKITVTCEKLHQQQLYQSWWAIGDTVHHELIPELQELTTTCTSFAAKWQGQ